MAAGKNISDSIIMITSSLEINGQLIHCVGMEYSAGKA